MTYLYMYIFYILFVICNVYIYKTYIFQLTNFSTNDSSLTTVLLNIQFINVSLKMETHKRTLYY